MDSNDIQRVNLVQSICMRPRMYTRNGTLAEVYALLTDDNGPQPIAGSRADASVAATLQWLRENAIDSDNIVNELLHRHGTDENALHAICKFASKLPPKTGNNDW